jgi:hypothetical protein
MKSLALMAGAIVLIWVFPKIWYTHVDTTQQVQWLSEQTNAPGWNYHAIAIDSSAERLLVADRLINGEFRKPDRGAVPIRVFGARRFKEDPKEIGLFVHTPDRCWVQGGWNLAPVSPDHVEVELHGRKVGFERRVFQVMGQQELVYFAGLVGGQTLPYRLDHNFSVSRRVVASGANDRVTQANRWNDSVLWKRVVDSFLSRRPLLGPKQFLRISTPIQSGNIEAADQRLREMLPIWLKPEELPMTTPTARP